MALQGVRILPAGGGRNAYMEFHHFMLLGRCMWHSVVMCLHVTLDRFLAKRPVSGTCWLPCAVQLCCAPTTWSTLDHLSLRHAREDRDVQQPGLHLLRLAIVDDHAPAILDEILHWVGTRANGWDVLVEMWGIPFS